MNLILRFALCVLLAVPMTAHAIGEPTMGIMGGMNIGKLTPGSGMEARNGILVGGNFEIPIKGFFFVQGDGYFAQKGATADAATLAAMSLSSYVLAYDVIEFAALAKAKFGIPAMRVEVYLGPTFGFAIARSVTTVAVGETTPEATDLGSQTNSTEFGLQIGMGADFEVNEDSFLFCNLRYTMGLTSISSIATSKNRGVIFLSGLRLKL